jgi:hypothetical protein
LAADHGFLPTQAISVMTVMPETDDVGTEKKEAGAFSVVNSASKDWRNSKDCPCNAAPVLERLSCKLKERLYFFQVSSTSSL